jgi:hypothetical protein
LLTKLDAALDVKTKFDGHLMMRISLSAGTAILYLFAMVTVAETPPQLRVGRAGHAFDHLGAYGSQAEAAAACGATIIYASGLGGFGYSGLPTEAEFTTQKAAIAQYNRVAKMYGIELSLGYLCATSIVKLDTFDKNWSDEFRDRFKTPPADWLQQDQNGRTLTSWYGGDYNPACMNNSDWRTYQEFMVRQQLETGHDAIFFDNPTVHPQGCYCPYCMNSFIEFVENDLPAAKNASTTDKQRELAIDNPKEFLRFRSTIGREFLEHMRRFARSINSDALITCNNSLNSPDRLYAQTRVHGYNIFEMSKVEDLVVVEDMVTQPRTDAGGRTFEYGPTYKQLHAIGHGKPIVAVALAKGDYHTAPNLVRLAMGEAAANGASYILWPTWPEEQRRRMIDAVRPQADLLRKLEPLLNDASFRDDVVLFLPFRRWTDVDTCAASVLAAALSEANVQYRVVSENDFNPANLQNQQKVFLVESWSVLTTAERTTLERFRESHGVIIAGDEANWLNKLRDALMKPSLAIGAPPTVRAVVRDQPNRTIVHLLNLNVERLSSFDDKVVPASDIVLKVRVPFSFVRDVDIHTCDEHGTTGPVNFIHTLDGDESTVDLKVPRLDVSAIVVISAR